MHIGKVQIHVCSRVMCISTIVPMYSTVIIVTEFRGRVDLFEYNRVHCEQRILKLTFIDRYTSSGGVSWFTEYMPLM